MTLSDPEDIEKMLDAIYPIELSWISGEEFGVYNWDYRIDVTVVPKESSYSNPDEQVRILKSQELLTCGEDPTGGGAGLSCLQNQIYQGNGECV